MACSLLALVCWASGEHGAQTFTIVELNCENLFDTVRDSLHDDAQFQPTGDYHWTPSRYWRKLNRTAQTIIAAGTEGSDWLPADLVALVEVENDTVLNDLCQRSALRNARYRYLVTHGSDGRGMNVALLYSPFTFHLTHWRAVSVKPIDGMKPTRDLLYAAGETIVGDTVHVIVAHAPSRTGGERATRRFRQVVAEHIVALIDSVRQVQADAKIVVAGDLNDYSSDASVKAIVAAGMDNISSMAQGRHGARGTYRYHGRWGSLDHIIVSKVFSQNLVETFILDEPFLLASDEKYGGTQPRRSYLGPRYLDGFSDHLPLVARFTLAR